MANLGAMIIDRVSKFERVLERQLKKVQQGIDSEKREQLTQQVRSERHRKLESMLDAFRAVLSSEINLEINLEINTVLAATHLENVTTLENFEESLKGLKAIEGAVSEEQQRELSKAGLRVLESNIDLVEDLLDRDVAAQMPIQSQTELRELRNKAERMWRLTLLRMPTNEQEFEVTLMWASQQGEDIELDTIQNLKSCLPYNSDKIQQLLQYAEKQITNRLESKAKTYKIFCSQEQLEQYLQGVQIIKSYPAFTIISALDRTIADIKLVFPVERLEFSEEPRPSGVSNMVNQRDQVIRFKTPVSDDWQQRIEAIGARVLRSLGRLEVVVAIPNPDHTAQVIEQLRNWEDVAQVTPYEPKIRVQTQYLERLGQPVTREMIAAARLAAATAPPPPRGQSMPLPGILIADFFTTDDRDHAAAQLESEGIRIAERPGATRLVLDLSRRSDAIALLDRIKTQTGLQSLEEKTIPTLFNNKARQLLGKQVIPSNPRPNRNGISLTGEGEIIAIADTGLDTGEPDTVHLDFQGRVQAIRSYALPASWDNWVLNPGSDDGASDTYSGHGTHVAGSALGSGKQAQELGLPEIPSGLAPGAQLIFQAIEQTAEWTPDAIYSWLYHYRQNPPRSGLFGVPEDLQQLFREAYEQGARIHSNSWGDERRLDYDTRCHDLDQFVWVHKDCLILVAAGNAGCHSSPDQIGIEPGCIGSPGIAKNCLTVGASETNRADRFTDTYGQRWPERFAHAPFHTDGIADSIDDIAAFSGRGPCPDGRRKPDVIAPGTFILSTRSSQIANNHFAWGAYPPAEQHYVYDTGTSMATPLVAGCAALVRQYLRSHISDHPSAALMKAVLIHSAQYLDYRSPHADSARWADHEQGWGRINLQQVLNPEPPVKLLCIDEQPGLKQGEQTQHQIQIDDPSVPLRATLVYTDLPGDRLINNLNLLLYSPSGRYYLGNDFADRGELDAVNNVEGVVIPAPEPGIWRITVSAELIDASASVQDYALVISGGGLEQRS